MTDSEFDADSNTAAALILGTRHDDLLAFHRLDLPSTLKATFQSTNIIVNTLRNWRIATEDVKHSIDQMDMVSLWMAS